MEPHRDPESLAAAATPVPEVLRQVPGSAAGRGTFAGETRFLAAAAGLAAVVLVEFLAYCLVAVAFLFIAPWYRKRMRRLILRSAGAGALALALLEGGCGGRERPATTETGDSWTFRGQMRQLEWSTKATIDQSDSRKSLEDDLEALGPDRGWKESLRFDVRHLFLMEDGRKSLEEDIETLTEPENHGLKETFKLWGW